MRLLPAVIAVVISAIPLSTFSQSTESGRALCYEIEKTINALVDYTQTSCIPTRGKAPGSYSFILLSSQPVFSVEASKKGWVIVAVGASGDVLNRNASVAVEELWLSDAAQTKSRTAYVVPASVAKTRQRRAKANQITLDGLYAEITKNLSRRSVPRK